MPKPSLVNCRVIKAEIVKMFRRDQGNRFKVA